jgi:hypothetical protein
MSAHGSRGDCKKMPTILPVSILGGRQPEIT